MSGLNENSEEDPLSSSDSDENEKTVVLREDTELIEQNEKEDGESSFIVALAPRVGLMEDSHLEVSASPAFHELDMIFRDGKLTGTKLALLKSKYTELHDALKSRRRNEQKLLQQAKEYLSVVEQQKVELEKADDFPDNSNTEVSKLRQQLLKYNNELKQSEERQEQLQYNTQCMEEDRKMLEKEYNRLPKQAEIEKRMEEMTVASTEMRKEINQRKLEVKTLKEDLDNYNRQIQIRSKDIEETTEQMQKLKADLVAANAEPNQIAKESEKCSRQKYDLEKKIKEMDEQIKTLRTQMHSLNMTLIKLNNEKDEQELLMRESSSLFSQSDRQFQIVIKDHEYAKNRETELLVDKTKLDMSLKHVNLEKANAHEIHARKVREKDQELRNLKKAELQLKVAQDALELTSQSHKKLTLMKSSTTPKDLEELKRTKQELEREVGHHRRALENQSGLTAVETMKIEQSIAEEERLLYEQSDFRIEVVELTRLAAIKNDERLQKVRDLQKAEQHFRHAREELKMKQLVIEDHKKKDQEMQIKLKGFAKLYDIIKNERNKCVGLIQASTQKAAEMREKIKILENEIEILRTTVAQKERQLQKHRMKHITGIVMRDSLRNEVSKQQRIEQDFKEVRDQQRMDISKLEQLIKHSEEQMLDLRKRYELEVKRRNERGVQLIERNEEVCIFNEKIRIQDEVIINGNVELTAKEEEIRFLRMKLTEYKRNREILRKRMPEKYAIEQELVTLQIQLSQCQDRMAELEKQVENPNIEERARFLDGKDLSAIEMQEKIEKLEARLAKKEEKSLEKDLIYEQVCRLTDDVAKKVENGKDQTLSLAKQVNAIKSKIQAKNAKFMALVAEYSMVRAQAFQLEQSIREKEAELERYNINLEKGEAPSAEIEQEWLRTIRDEERKINEKEMSKIMAEQEAMFTLADGSVSTAEPRPNAYIPTEEHELPIPRPYGHHAPFKPTEPGSTMRHIRKPMPKPIEL